MKLYQVLGLGVLSLSLLSNAAVAADKEAKLAEVARRGGERFEFVRDHG